MKFHCDRCKTRYSIGDERVRGKILKIRCKNCSAVITVREQKGDDDKPSAGSKKAAKREPKPEPERAPSPAESPKSGGIAASPSALRGAFQQVFERPVDDDEAPSPSPSDSFRAAPPDHFEQEWYVAIDGDQSGPFSLEEAKTWVGARPRDEEIFCWNEDFDDWLPAEKVSHFRGIRARAASAPAGAASAPAPATPAEGVAQRAHAALEEAAAASDSGALRGQDILNQETPKPLFAPTFAALEAAQKASDTDDAEHPPVNEDNYADTVQEEPRFAKLAQAGLPFSAGAAPAEAAAVSTPASLGIGGGDAVVAPEGAGRPDSSDFDLDIGEASRVVKVSTVADAAGGVPARGDAGLPGVARIRPGGALGAGAGADSAVPSLTPLSNGALADARPGVLVATPKRRANLVVPIVAGVAVIAVVLGVFLSLLRESDDDGPLARSKLADDELAYRTDGPERIKVITREVEKKSSGRRTPRDKGRSTSGNGSNGNGETNDTEPVNDSLRPLSPSDVIRASRENGLGNKRCYERALKKDPFLDVKKIKVTLSVAPSGVVTDLKMDSYANTFLGQCLASRIRKWPFRKSSKGITTQLTLSFEQM